MNGNHTSARGNYLGKLLRQMFPNQTKTPLQIILWALVYIVDVVLVFVAADALGIDIFTLSVNYQLMSVIVMLYLVVALGLFSIKVFLYNKIFR